MNDIAASTGARDSPLPSQTQPAARTVGILGFGLLGEAFALRLRDHGFAVVAYDPAAKRNERIGSLGIGRAPDVHALAAAARTVLLCVYDADQAAVALRALSAGVIPSAPLTVLCATTLAPDDASSLARAHAGSQLRLIEMPVSGSSRQVREGGALALLGTAALPADVRGVVDAICPVQLPVPGDGAAARLKLVINLVLESNRAALGEGLVLARAFGLDPALAENALKQSAAASRVMEHQGRKMREADFEPVARLDQSLKDLHAALAGGRDRFLPLASTVRQLLASASAAGDGGLDSAAVVRELQRRASRAGAATW
jgi:3-hydroxyisobutyrate dehydrogenase-like beta-hydroxyacid dehydrogenase